MLDTLQCAEGVLKLEAAKLNSKEAHAVSLETKLSSKLDSLILWRHRAIASIEDMT